MQQRPSDKGWAREAKGVRRQAPAYRPDPAQLNGLPPQAEVKNWKWPGYVPSNLEGCTASAIAAAVELLQDAPPEKRFRPSTGFIYFVARYLRMDEMHDTGASIHDGLRGAQIFGFCSESDWPIDKIDATTRPPGPVQQQAERYGIEEFRHLQRRPDQPDEIVQLCKSAINSGHAVLFGAVVDDAFLDGFQDSMDIPLPPPDAQLHHHHCLLAVKYDDADGGYFWVRDSLGPHRGDEGYLRMPYRYLTAQTKEHGFLTSDFWIVNRASTSGAPSAALVNERNRYWERAKSLSNDLHEAYLKFRQVPASSVAAPRSQFPPNLS
ncbi:MAG: hypothetical protein JOZ81_01790 [Chloroflexi bacterium]|nr:hypothetical protein [Chloroflexota bacterium]MBV9544931.1 hypothetical protein [Chloroflexota bacterium]